MSYHEIELYFSLAILLFALQQTQSPAWQNNTVNCLDTKDPNIGQICSVRFGTGPTPVDAGGEIFYYGGVSTTFK